ncbi:hypothetical protein TIFTF001_051520 [Ficus carica]|uniref:Uncharacterized protein n=1 Tax=Ficus carica TaxID=3494 RepID=A0AA87ZLR8_FICCA|nr:hypothetical protein TIFTF001_051520 [Ficus carica]
MRGRDRRRERRRWRRGRRRGEREKKLGWRRRRGREIWKDNGGDLDNG